MFKNHLFEELKIMVKNIKYLPYLYFDNKSDQVSYKELDSTSYDSPSDYVKSITDASVPKRKSFRKKLPKVKHDDSPAYEVSIYFINGICTNDKVAALNIKCLSEFFNRPISSLYNPTHGILVDLYECVLGRSFGKHSEAALMGAIAVKEALVQDKKVVLLGHSQGGIIASNIVNLLLNDKHVSNKQLELLEIYTFGSGARFQSNCNGFPYSEHFVNGGDYIARIGVLHHKYKVFGKFFVAENRTGHLMNAHYLAGLKSGEYGYKSKLFDYIGK